MVRFRSHGNRATNVWVARVNVSTIASAIFDPPAPRWKTYGCTHRGRMDAWVTPEELARIDAGVTSGTIETRVVPDQIGKIHQWREKAL